MPTLLAYTLCGQAKGLTEWMNAIELSVKDYLGLQQQVAGAGKLRKALWFSIAPMMPHVIAR